MNIEEIQKNTQLSPLDAEILLSLVINKPKEYLFAHPEKKLSKSQIIRYKLYATRRLHGEPIAYITGKKEFYGLEFVVGKNVLIPRPETELLVEKTINHILDTRCQILDTIIDIGTGSGNIIISLVKSIPAQKRKKMKFYATDIFKKALFIAKKNAKKHRADKYIKFIQSDLLEYFLEKKTKFENLLIVANLPYVSPQIYRKYKRNLKFEPKRSLLSAKGGLDHYGRLFQQICNLTPGYALRVTCFAEVSPEQKNLLAKIVKEELPSAKIKFSKDLSGKIRMAEILIGN